MISYNIGQLAYLNAKRWVAVAGVWSRGRSSQLTGQVARAQGAQRGLAARVPTQRAGAPVRYVPQVQPEPHLLWRLLHPRPPVHHGNNLLCHPLLEQGAALAGAGVGVRMQAAREVAAQRWRQRPGAACRAQPRDTTMMPCLCPRRATPHLCRARWPPCSCVTRASWARWAPSCGCRRCRAWAPVTHARWAAVGLRSVLACGPQAPPPLTRRRGVCTARWILARAL